MSTTPPLALSNIVTVDVTVSPAAAQANSFNQGLIVGNSGVIPPVGSNPRLRAYTTLTAILADGFTSDDPEYIAAQLYFSQTPKPVTVWIGAQVPSAISAAIPHTGNAGTGYVVGDIVGVTQSGANGGFLRVASIGGGGAVATLQTIVGEQGEQYTVGTALATTGGSGTGLEVDITAIGESALQAVEACRIASNIWYGVMVCGAADADCLAISQWADPLWQTTRFYPATSTVGVANGVSNTLALELQALNLRVLLTYATTQSDLYPNNAYVAAAVMGVDMGSNTGLAGSFYTMAHKQLQGIAPEPLTQTQYQNLLTANCNVYGNFNPYTLYEAGFLSNGDPSFFWLYLAVLCAQLQIDVMNVLIGVPALPQTNSGEHQLIQGANVACQNLANIGFISGGTWNGVDFSIVGVSIANGQALPSGYIIQAQPYSQQSPSDRAAGKAMPLYVFITTAGAVQSVVIGVNVQL